MLSIFNYFKILEKLFQKWNFKFLTIFLASSFKLTTTLEFFFIFLNFSFEKVWSYYPNITSGFANFSKFWAAVVGKIYSDKALFFIFLQNTMTQPALLVFKHWFNSQSIIVITSNSKSEVRLFWKSGRRLIFLMFCISSYYNGSRGMYFGFLSHVD